MPISGMTGFGRAEGALDGWSWAVEARSVNGRNLEFRFRGPLGFEGLERRARAAAQARFQRGNVTAGLHAKCAQGAGQVRINFYQLERYLDVSAPYVANGRAAPPSIDGLLGLRGVIEAEDTVLEADTQAALEDSMTGSIVAAFDALEIVRRQEGAALLGVLDGQMERIGKLVAQAGALAAGQPVAIKARFETRLKELAGEVASEERIVQEAATMAVRADVQEELDRLASHVDAARALLATDGTVGRRLDFLTQEFMREANTLCSKSATGALTVIGLDLKAVIEQFREQVQNVE